MQVYGIPGYGRWGNHSDPDPADHHQVNRDTLLTDFAGFDWDIAINCMVAVQRPGHE